MEPISFVLVLVISLLDLFINCCIVALVLAPFLWIYANFAEIEGATFYKSFMVELVSSFFFWVAMVIGGFFDLGLVFGFIVGVPITIITIKKYFKTTWRQAFLAGAFQVIAVLLLFGIIILFVSVDYLLYKTYSD